MTTIATDGRSMAGDGQREIHGTIVIRDAQKVRRLSDGRIVGTAGDVAFGMAIVEWLEDGGDPPKLEDGGCVLVLTPAGEVFHIDKYCKLLPVQVPVAIGSGMDMAIGAMEHGASPFEAVTIAARRDPGTGGEIAVLLLEPQEVRDAA